MQLRPDVQSDSVVQSLVVVQRTFHVQHELLHARSFAVTQISAGAHDPEPQATPASRRAGVAASPCGAGSPASSIALASAPRCASARSNGVP